MSYFDKQFVLDSQENFEEFVNSFGDDVSEEYKESLINHKSEVKLSKDGDQFVFESSKPSGDVNKIVFESGVAFEETTGQNNDIVIKSAVTMDGDTMTHVQNYPNGVMLAIVREFSDDELVATFKSTAWDGIAKRIYKPVE